MADIDWDAYAQVADAYLKRDVFIGTPIRGNMLTKAAKNTYNKYGITIPIELALSQAQIESSMGRTGRNPYTNPYNVYEYDSGTKKRYKNIQSGINAYYDLIARRYLAKNTVDNLLLNFVNDKGQRYASDPNYENKIRNQYEYIMRNYSGGG